MPRPKQMMKAMKPWSAQRAVKEALFSPRADKSWCTFETASWLLERVNLALAVPGTFAGDVRNGGRMVASWDGLPMYDGQLKPGVVLAEKDGRTFHVRLDEGDVHEGHPDQCDGDRCLAERIMLE